MRKRYLSLISLLCFPIAGCETSLSDYKPTSAEEREVLEVMVALEDAWNRNDVAGVSAVLYDQSSVRVEEASSVLPPVVMESREDSGSIKRHLLASPLLERDREVAFVVRDVGELQMVMARHPDIRLSNPKITIDGNTGIVDTEIETDRLSARAVFVVESDQWARWRVVDWVVLHSGWYTEGKAASGWRQVNPNVSLVDNAGGRQIDLYDVHVVSASKIVAVGDNGVILESNDFGTTWQQQEQSLTTRHLRGVFFVDPSIGFVVGKSRTILRTTNGGEDWTLVPPPEILPGLNYDILSVHFTDYYNGVAVGSTVGGNAYAGGFGIIIRTTDGGQTWIGSSLPWDSRALYDVDFSNSAQGLGVGGTYSTWSPSPDYTFWGELLRTTDGGVTWSRGNIAANWLHAVWGVAYLDQNSALAVGNANTIGKTTDSGQTWSSPNPELDVHFSHISFPNESRGIIVGCGGLVRTTDDGGQTWVGRSSGTNVSLSRVSFLDANRGATVGRGFTALVTSDGGITWTGQKSITLSDLYDVSLAGPSTGAAVGAGGIIIYTGDGGQTWTVQKGGGFDLFAVDMVDSNTGTAVGLMEQIYRTVDGGDTWVRQNEQPYDPYLPRLYGVDFFDAQQGIAVGTKGTILRTADGGDNWAGTTFAEELTLRDVFFTSSSVAYVVGDQGTILKTVDGGTNWIQQTSGVTGALLRVFFTDEGTGWVVGKSLPELYGGGDGIILHTTDGGSTWTQQQSGTGFPLRDVSFIDSSGGMAVGGWGCANCTGTHGAVILRTDDGGASWRSQEIETTKTLYGVRMIDLSTAVALGRDGTILRTTSGGN
jgi:photosystem II stability/assembly factor-like uncharacterized protein